MINLFDPKQVDFVGILSYRDKNYEKKEIKTDIFWEGTYTPDVYTCSLFLQNLGITDFTDVKYVRVM
jgi:hypothetical protein